MTDQPIDHRAQAERRIADADATIAMSSDPPTVAALIAIAHALLAQPEPASRSVTITDNGMAT